MTNMRARLAGLGGAAVLTGSLMAAAPAQAAAPVQNEPEVTTSAADQQRSDDMTALVANLNHQGASWVEIKDALEAEGASGLSEQDPRESVVVPLSSSRDVALNYFQYYDTQQGEYAAVGEFEWVNSNWSRDAEVTCTVGQPVATPCEVGGDDAVGLAFRNAVDVSSTTAVFCLVPGSVEALK